MRKTVIIVAGGSGNRMKSDIPKQFIVLKSKPLLMHTIIAFFNYDNSIEIVLVLPENHISYWEKLVEEYNFSIPLKIVKGGEERFYSVKNGLDITETDLVAIHDAVRPFVSNTVIEEAFKLAELKGNAIPAVVVSESVRMLVKEENKAINRNDIMLVQTPQCFNTDLIKKAYETEFKAEFTDDASVLEAMGEKIYLSAGNEMNIKITRPVDLLIAEVMAANKSKLNL